MGESNEMTDQTTDRMVRVPDDLGAIGLGASADILELGADQVKNIWEKESLQMVADWLRQVAVQVPVCK